MAVLAIDAAAGVDLGLQLQRLAQSESKLGMTQGFAADRGIRAAGMRRGLAEVAADGDQHTDFAACGLIHFPRPAAAAGSGKAAGEDSIVMVTSVIHSGDSWASESCGKVSVDPQGAWEMVTVPSNFRTGYLYAHLLYR